MGKAFLVALFAGIIAAIVGVEYQVNRNGIIRSFGLSNDTPNSSILVNPVSKPNVGDNSPQPTQTTAQTPILPAVAGDTRLIKPVQEEQSVSLTAWMIMFVLGSALVALAWKLWGSGKEKRKNKAIEKAYNAIRHIR